MAWRPPQNPLDKPLEDAVADSIKIARRGLSAEADRGMRALSLD